MNPDQPYSMFNCKEIHSSAYDLFASGVLYSHDESCLRAFYLVANQISNILQPLSALDVSCSSAVLSRHIIILIWRRSLENWHLSGSNSEYTP